LGELVLEQVELPVAGARELAQAVELRLQARRLGECGCACAQAFTLLRPADAVEDLQLGRRQRELAMLVLAVESEQARADVAQVRPAAGRAHGRAPSCRRPSRP